MPERDRPNLLILFCDQLRADALGPPDGLAVDTPALDALAARGVRFTSAYTPSPVCVPARAAFMTGLEPQSSGCFENGYPMPEASTFADALTASGYRTHGIGKLHFTPDPLALRGLETREVGEEFGDVETDDYLAFVAAEGYGEVERPLGLRDEMYYVPQLSPVPERLHHSHWVADRSIAFLDDAARDGSRPFLLWAGFIAPHPPFTPPSPWHRRYEPSTLPDPFVPAGSEGLRTVWNELQNRYKFRDGGDDRRLTQLLRAYYAASVTFLDEQVGRILAALDRRGLRDSTHVVLTADHGEFLGDYGSWGKRSFLDASARIPLVISGPGIDPGHRDGPVSLTDGYATLLALAGVAAEDRDSADLFGPDAERTFFGQYQSGELAQYAVITGEWKYVWSAADRREILVDRIRDPRESTNVAYDIRRRPELERMRALAREHFVELVDLVWDDATDNVPLPLGDPPSPAALGALRALAADRDASTLIVDPGPAAPR